MDQILSPNYATPQLLHPLIYYYYHLGVGIIDGFVAQKQSYIFKVFQNLLITFAVNFDKPFLGGILEEMLLPNLQDSKDISKRILGII